MASLLAGCKGDTGGRQQKMVGKGKMREGFLGFTTPDPVALCIACHSLHSLSAAGFKAATRQGTPLAGLAQHQHSRGSMATRAMNMFGGHKPPVLPLSTHFCPCALPPARRHHLANINLAGAGHTGGIVSRLMWGRFVPGRRSDRWVWCGAGGDGRCCARRSRACVAAV